MASLLLGLLVPASLITIQSLFDNTIHTLEDVEDIVKAPILGEIPTSKSQKEIISFTQKNNDAAESFRLLRTNVNHMLLNINNDGNIGKRAMVGSTIEMAEKSNYEKMMFEPALGKARIDTEDIVPTQIGATRAPVICVTSTIRKEGKTFVAINLATALALLNKSVLLIEADLRYPKFSDYLQTKQQKGLTHFLADPSLALTDLITHHEKTNLDVLQAGSIPQSPSELLANGRFDEVIMHGKQHYDYVVIDTSAVNIATDTLLLSHYADLIIYVIRADFLNQKKLQIPKNMHENRRLPNMAILMNGTNYEKRGYESTYSFG